MGEALAAGLLSSGWQDLVVVERDPRRGAELSAAHPEISVTATPVPGEGAVVAVKPGDVESACRSLSGLGVSRCLSIAAGVTLASLESWVDASTAVLRAMPNTPAVIGAGASALATGRGTCTGDIEWASAILGAVGTVVVVPESCMDAVTGLSGSGPAYLFLVAEALIDAGVMAGLSAQVSTSLVVQTLLGSARLLSETGEPPARLRSAVTSPGGTTAAGLRVLELGATRATFIEAVAAATSRAAELGRATAP